MIFLRKFCAALLVAFFIFSPNIIHAKIAYETVEGRGTGANPKEAVLDALKDALGKVNGMQMASREMSSLCSVKVQAKVNNKTDTAEVSSSAYKQQIYTATKGVIRKYDVISIAPDQYSKGLVQAIVKATVAKYKRSKQANRNRIAVLPFRVANNQDIKQTTFAKQFAQGLVSYLTQTRKFAVLDRDFSAESNRELNSLKSANVPVEELARLGNRLGADFIIVGQINKAVAKQWYKEMKSTGKKFPMTRYGAALTYRVMDVATGQILASQLCDNIQTQQGRLPDMSHVAKATSEKIGRTIVEGIFPLTVVSVSGKSVFLGQGGETVKKGQKYKLVQYGKRIIDPHTKESLGREEIAVGIVKVVDVQAKVSRATIVSADVDINKLFAPNTFIVRPIAGVSRAVKQKVKAKKVKKELTRSMEKMEKESDDDW